MERGPRAPLRFALLLLLFVLAVFTLPPLLLRLTPPPCQDAASPRGTAGPEDAAAAAEAAGSTAGPACACANQLATSECSGALLACSEMRSLARLGCAGCGR